MRAGRYNWALLGILPLLVGCVGNPPKGLEPGADDALTRVEVQRDPQAFVGRTVRWGGEILAVRNLQQVTEVELYGRGLFDNAEPRPDGGDGVRFIAVVKGFLDPAEYAPGKRLTVRGELLDGRRQPVGDYPYIYPVVSVSHHNLWPVYQEPPDPYWLRDPYYDPWWPWGPWWPHRHWY